jgi:hypothetical protein
MKKINIFRQKQVDTPQFGVYLICIYPEQYQVYASLAQHCPMQNYDVVYRSRAIVRSQNDSIDFQDSTLCAQIGITLKQSKPIAYNKIISRPIVFEVYPNPTRSKIRIATSEILKGVSTFIIQDILGRELYSTSKEMTTNVQEIDMSNWSSGIYFLRILQNNKSVFHRQIQLIN